MPGRLDFSFEFRGMGEQVPHQHGAHEPIRILLIADLGGRDDRGAAASKPLSERVPARVDVDNFEDMLRRMRPALALAVGDSEEGADAPKLSIEFNASCVSDSLIRLPMMRRRSS